MPPRSSAADLVRPARDHSAALPACGLRAGRLPACDDAVGRPRSWRCRRLPTMTTKIGSLFSVSAQAGARGGGLAPLRMLTVARCAPQHVILGRRAIRCCPKAWQSRLVHLGWGRCCRSPCVHGPAFCPSSCPIGPFQCGVPRVAYQFISFDNFTLQDVKFVLL